MKSNDSATTIGCALCIGAAREPYLETAVAAIANAVDFLSVNDNSGLVRSDNVRILEKSAFGSRGALTIRRHPFVDFADMRNRAFDDIAANGTSPDWMLFLDADEVHGEQLAYIARDILPRLPRSVGSVDAYTYHLYGTFRWMTDIARRFCFYRYARDLRWVNPVHEKIEGLRGSVRVVPYVYHHFGNVVPPAALARKYGVYHALGNPVPAPPAESEATVEMFVKRAADVRPFTHGYPAIARQTIAALEREFAADFLTIDAGFRAYRSPSMRTAAAVRGANERLRVALRHVERPLAYREETVGR